ncbi:MAG: MBL fold metallo-hydrolase [Actinomycetota bacterium]
MDLTVLGCSGSYPTAETMCSGYLLRHDGSSIWLDAGSGTMGELQKHVKLDDVGAIVLSHSHMDHCGDLYPFFYAALFDTPPRDVYAPSGVRDRLGLLIGKESTDAFVTRLRWHELDAGSTIDVGPFSIEAFEAVHSTRNNTMRITAGGRVLTYSGDTAANPHLARAAREAHVFLCESTWTNDQKGLMGPVHLSAGETGDAAAAAGCERLLITHIWPTNDRNTIKEQAAERFLGTIDLALETRTITI